MEASWALDPSLYKYVLYAFILE